MKATLKYELNDHITKLCVKYKLKVKVDDIRPRYSVLTDIVHLPSINAPFDYIVNLHEIGHSQCPFLKKTVEEFRRLKAKYGFLTGNDDISDNQNAQRVLEQRIALQKKLAKVHGKCCSQEFEWKLESEAWKFAVKNTKIWKSSWESKIRKSMDTYFFGRRHNGWNTPHSKEEYARFKENYVDCIFDTSDKIK